MACDDTGKFRMLEEGEQPNQNEVVFKTGELIALRGRVFKLENVFPNPENRIILKCIGKAEEANMI